MALWACLLPIMCMLRPVHPGPRYSSRIVDTQAGPVRGIIQGSTALHLEPVEIFYGIPYAAAPMEGRRFQPAAPPPPWNTTRLAEKPSPVCPQNLPDISNSSAALEMMPWSRYFRLQQTLPLLKNQSEDCLYLNIYVPGSGSRGIYAPYAVILLVHGESYEWNTGSIYDGRTLTSFGHVIFITINYRLGVLGFLMVEEESKDNQHCCFAISDIETALRWVQTNIEAFGGDARRVTVMGHDTGAAMVNALLLRKSARGLFHRVSLLSGSMLSPWAAVRDPFLQRQTILEKVGCSYTEQRSLIKCLQDVPLQALMEASDYLHPSRFLTRWGPWFGHSPAAELERAGDTFIDRQLLLGLASLESYHDLPARHVETGLDLDEKDDILRTFVNQVYSYHTKEIFSAVRNEYTEWNESQDSLLRVRDSVLQALGDGHTAAALVKLAYLHSRRGATTYMFHLGHQLDQALRSLGLSSVRGDILPYVLGHPLSDGSFHGRQQDLAIAHAVLRFFTNFAKTGDPNSPGAEPDYENDKSNANVWDMYEPVKQSYLSIGDIIEVRSHYRGHKMALWLNLIEQLLTSGNDFERYKEFEEEDNLYAGVVRPKTFQRASTPTPAATPASGLGCVWNLTVSDRALPPLQDAFSLAGPWGVTFAIGCLLLLCNLLLFASVYHKHFRVKATCRGLELRLRPRALSEDRVMAKSQSAPDLTFQSEMDSPQLLKRPQNKLSV